MRNTRGKARRRVRLATLWLALAGIVGTSIGVVGVESATAAPVAASAATIRASSSIEVVSISNREWRVSDRARAAKEGFGVLAYIEQTNGVFEVTRLSAPSKTSYFSSLAEAVAFVS